MGNILVLLPALVLLGSSLHPFVSPQFILCLVHVEAAAGSVALTNPALCHRGSVPAGSPGPSQGRGGQCVSQQVMEHSFAFCLSVSQMNVPGLCRDPARVKDPGSACWCGFGTWQGTDSVQGCHDQPSPTCQQRMVALCCWQGQAGS